MSEELKELLDAHRAWLRMAVYSSATSARAIIAIIARFEKAKAAMSESRPVAVSAWVPVATLPPAANHDYYGDYFSIPVLLNVPHAKLFRWSFRRSGWVEAGWSDGHEPWDYGGWKLDKATHWQPLPAPPAALAVNEKDHT